MRRKTIDVTDEQMNKLEIVSALSLCPCCARGDCYGHQYDYLDKGVLTLCRCTNPENKHGKMRKKLKD